MRNLLLAATLTVASATTAIAGGVAPTTTPPPAVTPAAPVYNWGGFYAGLSYGEVSGGITRNSAVPTQLPDLVGTGAGGGFVGYNWQTANNLVFGGELNITSFDTPYVGFPISIQSDSTELRGRVGMALNRALFYGFVGYAETELSNGGTIFEMDGVVYGLGVDVMITERFFGGIEVARRDVSGANGFELDVEIDTVALRLGVRF
ncbi:outer membrane protein [Roseicyclus persicicus]|uniref:Porin family protein n=1 Tax=Roseicyclus persicicus TaxID=2650661 RepID=A0A7X6JYS9_9RHOB|nr:outer membrane beta-barrel protein [Roseibacterium persicicum]NKX46200.1 porin family protein [Roseibacterium persicicum]